MGRFPRACGLIARYLRLLCLLPLVLTAGCGEPRPLRIALHPWIGYETLTLAEDFGWLPPAVELQRGATVSDSLAALRSGRAAVAATTLDEALRLCAEIHTLQVILVMDESAGGDVLVARPEISELRELAGRRVAYEDSAVTKLLLYGALERAGLSADDIQHVHLTVDEHLAAYREGRIDASVAFEPHSGDLEAAGARRLFDSRALPGLILDVLLVDTSRIAGHRDTLEDVVAAHFRALTYLRNNPEDAVYRIAGYQGRSAADVRAALDGVRLPGETAVRELLSGRSGALAAAVERYQALQLIDMAPRLEDFTSVRYLPPPRSP